VEVQAAPDLESMVEVQAALDPESMVEVRAEPDLGSMVEDLPALLQPSVLEEALHTNDVADALPLELADPQLDTIGTRGTDILLGVVHSIIIIINNKM